MANLPPNNYVLFEINAKLDRILKAFEVLLEALPKAVTADDLAELID